MTKTNIRSKVMRIANRLVKQGFSRPIATSKAWKIVKYKAITSKVAGTSFNGRQDALKELCKYNPKDVQIQLVREANNQYDSNAIAVMAIIKDKFNSTIGYLPKAVASVISALMDKGDGVSADTLAIVGGYNEYTNYGARVNIAIN